MSPSLREINRYEEMLKLGSRLAKRLENNSLDYGICHMDLKPDNIHIHNSEIVVFDFDSAGESWRAIEPYRDLEGSKEHFQKWLDGYREIRDFNSFNENAVPTFLIIGNLRNAVWNLGFAESSRGKPTLNAQDLDKMIDQWLKLESTLY